MRAAQHPAGHSSPVRGGRWVCLAAPTDKSTAQAAAASEKRSGGAGKPRRCSAAFPDPPPASCPCPARTRVGAHLGQDREGRVHQLRLVHAVHRRRPGRRVGTETLSADWHGHGPPCPQPQRQRRYLGLAAAFRRPAAGTGATAGPSSLAVPIQAGRSRRRGAAFAMAGAGASTGRARSRRRHGSVRRHKPSVTRRARSPQVARGAGLGAQWCRAAAAVRSPGRSLRQTPLPPTPLLRPLTPGRAVPSPRPRRSMQRLARLFSGLQPKSSGTWHRAAASGDLVELQQLVRRNRFRINVTDARKR